MKIPLFDAHCDTLHVLATAREAHSLMENRFHVDLRRGMRYSPWAQVFALYAQGPEAPRIYGKMLDVFRSETERHAEFITHCRNGGDASRAAQKGKCAAFLSVEGAEQLSCSEEELEKAADLGVRAVNPTWNHANVLSGSNAEEPERGLSEKGRAFVRTCGRRGVLVDVSHLSDPGFWDVIEIPECRVIASHSNARALCGHPRNLTDDMFRALCERGGVAGLNFCPRFLGEEPDVDTMVRHLEHFLDLGGEKHVGIGADLDGIGEMPKGFSGVQDVEKLWLRLRDLGYGEELLRDLFYFNFMRAFA